MFGKGKLLRDGAQINGVLIESDEDKAYENSTGTYKVRVRVSFEDGTSTEFDERVHVKQVGRRGIGAVVPVRYDPLDHSKIAVDGKEIERRRETDERQQKEAFAATPEPFASNDPHAQLRELWERRKKMAERGSELRRSGAPREEVGAWVHENEALESQFRALKDQNPGWSPPPSE